MKKNRAGITLAELIIAMVCGAILTCAAVVIIIFMIRAQGNAQQELMREAEKKTAVEHLNILTRKSSYVKIKNSGSTLELYGYNNNLTGTYADQAAGLTYTGAAPGLTEQFKDVRAAFTKIDGPAGIADIATEIKVDFTSPSISTTYIKPRAYPPPLAMLYGGVKSDSFIYGPGNILQTSDDGYIFAGTTYSFDPSDSLVVKINTFGAIQWAKTYGNADINESQGGICATNDGGYIFGVSALSATPGASGGIVKIDSSGNVQWAKTYYSSQTWGGLTMCSNDPSFCQTADGGYLITGWVTFQRGTVYPYEAIIIKIDSNGNFQWAKSYKPPTGRKWQIYSFQKTSDGGYILGGNSSNDGSRLDLTHLGDFLLIKLNSSCNLEWAKVYNTGSDWDILSYVQEANGGGYIMAGGTEMTDRSLRSLVIKTSSAGTAEWAKIYYRLNPLNPRIDKFECVQNTSDGGYIFIGESSSTSGYGAILVKTDSLGLAEWVKLYMRQIGESVVRTRDNGYIMASSMGNPSYGSPYDMAIVKTDGWGNSGYADIYMNKTDYTVSNIAISATSASSTQSNLTYTASSVSPTVVKRTLTVKKISDLF